MHQGTKGNCIPSRLENLVAIPHLNRRLTYLRWAWTNVGIVSSEATMNVIYSNIVNAADRFLSGINCTVGAAIQPVTKYHLQAARDLGGDAIDLDPAKGDFVSTYTL